MSIIIKARENWLQYSTSLLFAICIIALPAYTSVGKMAFNLLALLSLFYLARNFHELKTLDPLIKIFFVVIVVGFLWTLLTFYINGSPGRGKNFIWSRQVFLLFLPTLYLLFRKVKIPFYVLWISILISVVLAAYVGYQDTLSGWQRAKGGMHPILFGSILLCEAFLLLVIAIRNDHLLVRIASVAGFFLAILVVIWTQSRGVWIAAPVLMVLLIIVLMSQSKLSLKFIVVGLLAAGVLLVSQYPVVKDRINFTEKNIKMYMENNQENHWSQTTSVGTRLEMLKAGWQIFLENPITGVGIGGYDLAAKAGKDRYGVNASAYWFYHPHNQYISALSTRGFVGFGFLVAFLFLPILIVYKQKNLMSMRDPYAIMLVLICIAYMVYGLSDVPLEGKATIVFLVTIGSQLLSHINHKVNPDQSKGGLA